MIPTDQPARVYEAAELLGKLRDSFIQPETVLTATLSLVAGQPARRVAEALTVIRADLKEAGLPGDSSVGTIRAACQALADAFGPETPVPRWNTANDARRAQREAGNRSKFPIPGTTSEAEIKRLVKIVLRLRATATDAELIAELRRHADKELVVRNRRQ